MEVFFGTPWSEVTLDVVRVFLDEAESEGLTWEAKGTERPHPGTVRKAISAFGNSEQGGFLLIGASRRKSVWQFDPIDFGDEPTTWLSRVIRGGVTPVPSYEVREWRIEPGYVALVRVDPVSEPPCMTATGEVFIRVSGESVRVTDPETLRRLYARGAERVERAMGQARRAAEPEYEYTRTVPTIRMTSMGFVEETGRAELRLRVAFAPVAAHGDVEARVLRRSFAEILIAQAEQLPPAPLFPYHGYSDFDGTMDRTGLLVREASDENPQRWSVQVGRDATTTVSLAVTVEPCDAARLYASAVVSEAVAPAIATASAVAAQVGGEGQGFLVISVVGRNFEIASGDVDGEVPNIPNGLLTVRRIHPYTDGIEAWMEVGDEPSPDLLARIERELLRVCGVAAWEPEPE
ncbi:MAG TPA: ATP-binding protein [Gaiellaceae bacterium]|nr:ATP-binding protein [Gaiellaceae bacterium]